MRKKEHASSGKLREEACPELVSGVKGLLPAVTRPNFVNAVLGSVKQKIISTPPTHNMSQEFYDQHLRAFFDQAYQELSARGGEVSDEERMRIEQELRTLNGTALKERFISHHHAKREEEVRLKQKKYKRHISAILDPPTDADVE